MKRTFLLAPLLGFAALSAPSLRADTAPNSDTMENAPIETMLAAARLRIPAGQSYWDVVFSRETTLTPLKLYWVQSPICTGFAANVDVLDARTNQWVSTRFDGGSFVSSVPTSTRLRVFLQQNRAPVTTCDVQLRTVTDPNSPPNAPTVKTLAGVVEFSGGFASNARVQLTTPLLAQQLEIVVPAYCDGTEVLEASVARGESHFKGTLSSTRPLTLSLPQPQVFDAVELTLVGPQGKACQLPVYAWAKTPVPTPVPNPAPTEITATEFSGQRETFEVNTLNLGE
jgi:hypothetical protein